jgi:hypothetical protein
VPVSVLFLQVGSWCVLFAAYAFAGIGVVRLLFRRKWVALGIILLAFLYFAILIGPVTATRYRVVMLPALSVAASIGIGRSTGIRMRRADEMRYSVSAAAC